MKANAEEKWTPSSLVKAMGGHKKPRVILTAASIGYTGKICDKRIIS